MFHLMCFTGSLNQPVTSTLLSPKHTLFPLTLIESLSLHCLLFSPPSSTLSICKMSISFAKSSFQGGPTLRKKRVVRCGCGDVCKVSVARTLENYGKKFYRCPNYKVEEEDCGFFKWYDEEDGHIIDPTHTKQMQGHGQLKTLNVVTLYYFTVVLNGDHFLSSFPDEMRNKMNVKEAYTYVKGAVSRFITASKEAINLGADESAIVDMRSSLTTRSVIHNK
ncbi:unnamed protein product [Lactuca saligna]|uniref:GRF-type domain-containing protein n=1 Tax=Lactuca saligna TaxID=75948 RepID=A0AA35URL3_LACSI|nr:unnamed protein product [Lactuca saligna]